MDGYTLQSECLVCLAVGPRDEIPHEPWCASFLRCVDESADDQLTLEEASV